INREGQHLRQVCFDESVWTVHDIMEEPIRSLVAQAPVNQLHDKRRQPLPVIFPLRGQRSNHARKSRSRPAVTAAPEFFSILRFLAVIPNVRQQFLLGVPKPYSEAV